MTADVWLPPVFLKTRDEADLWNALMSHAGTPLPLAPPRAAATFMPGQPPEPGTAAVLVGTSGGPDLVVVPRHVPLNAMFGSDIAIADVQRLDPALRDMINDGLLRLVWGALPANSLGRARIVASGAVEDVAALAERKWLDVVVDGLAAEPLLLSVGILPGEVLKVVAAGGLAPAAVTSALAARLLTEAAYTLGSIDLPLTAYRRLEAGDLLVPAELPEGVVLVRVDWITYAFRATDKGWTCVGHEQVDRYRAASPELSGTLPMTETGTPAELPAGLSVVVDFDLGRVSVPLAEVSGWKPGQIVGLAPPAPANGLEVTLRVNGQAVGTGDLVRIDDRVAVRITRLIGG